MFVISSCSEVFLPKARCAEHAILMRTVKRGTLALRRGTHHIVHFTNQVKSVAHVYYYYYYCYYYY
jgi:hypothetical protein